MDYSPSSQLPFLMLLRAFSTHVQTKILLSFLQWLLPQFIINNLVLIISCLVWPLIHLNSLPCVTEFTFLFSFYHPSLSSIQHHWSYFYAVSFSFNNLLLHSTLETFLHFNIPLYVPIIYYDGPKKIKTQDLCNVCSPIFISTLRFVHHFLNLHFMYFFSSS